MNIAKCAVITFHRSSAPILFDYILNNSALIRKTSIRDLGIVISHSLGPESHIDAITTKASRNLGFLIRTSRSGLSVAAMKFIFTALVRSVLEYGSVVWSPYEVGHIQQLQSVQDRFLRVVGVRCGFECRTVPLEDLGISLGLNSIVKRRQLLDVVFFP
ncbi:uncharacterized protein LOC124368146 [Homalodisca vitripennis]|uniref:uncharacterized protein LOC124368146 n=1 Tax=Homalodisca vitripennis TaxID=197043 RepID=UPI001EECD731|nr:uncharacterized protein LOC124368146 [Homalodisca vitripennis]